MSHTKGYGAKSHHEGLGLSRNVNRRERKAQRHAARAKAKAMIRKEASDA